MKKSDYLTLPKRVFQSPLIEYANFADGSFVNLIRLVKPYANGICFAVYETTKSAFCSNGLFKTYDQAKAKFELMVKNGQLESKLLKRNITGNALYPGGVDRPKYCLSFHCTNCGNEFEILSNATDERIPCSLCKRLVFGTRIQHTDKR